MTINDNSSDFQISNGEYFSLGLRYYYCYQYYYIQPKLVAVAFEDTGGRDDCMFISVIECISVTTPGKYYMAMFIYCCSNLIMVS